MESVARLRFCGLSAQKMRQVADLVRGKDVDVALHSLQMVTKAAARPMEKLIKSAVANAREKAHAADERFDADAYFVKRVSVDDGPAMKRFRPRAQGRAYTIRKRSCHVDLILEALPEAARRRRAQRPVAAAAVPEATAEKAGAKRGRKPKAAAAGK